MDIRQTIPTHRNAFFSDRMVTITAGRKDDQGNFIQKACENVRECDLASFMRQNPDIANLPIVRIR